SAPLHLGGARQGHNAQEPARRDRLRSPRRSRAPVVAYHPERGHLVWVSFHPTLGHEQGGRRPAVVLSPGFYNKRSGMMVVCPITSRAKGSPFEVPLPEGLPVSGVALADHIRSLDYSARPIQPIGVLPQELLEEILARSRALLS